jgi:hypothetical protein
MSDDMNPMTNPVDPTMPEETPEAPMAAPEMPAEEPMAAPEAPTMPPMDTPAE